MYLSRKIKKESHLLFVAIGVFDGIHFGHQKIIKRIVNKKNKRYKSAIITFSSHPQKAINKNKPPLLITTLLEKLYLLSNLDVDKVFVLPTTTHLLKMTPEEFIEKILHKINVKKVVVGENFLFGHKKSGNANTLQELGKIYNFDTYIIKSIVRHNEIVSSTKIRALLVDGKIEYALKYLGHPLIIIEKVIKGNNIGSNILGIKTANLKPEKDKLLPKNGVYCGWAEVWDNIPKPKDGKIFFPKCKKLKAVINIGICPTFSKIKKTVEVHLIDKDMYLYDKYLKVEIVKRIRDEIKFKNPKQLKDRIKKDIQFAKKYLKEN